MRVRQGPHLRFDVATLVDTSCGFLRLTCAENRVGMVGFWLYRRSTSGLLAVESNLPSIHRVSSVIFQIEICRSLRLGSAFQFTCSVPHMLTFPYSRSHNPLCSYHISHLADFKTTNQILHRKTPDCPNLGLYAYNNPICMYGMVWCGIHKGLKDANLNTHTHKTESHQTDKPINL